ncbi:MAG: flagellar motor switch protein FliN [Alphaproteobacteria bacterium]|nr:flagellar motor switch protein FliN [Alphaproteobacteria bacterium]
MADTENPGTGKDDAKDSLTLTELDSGGTDMVDGNPATVEDLGAVYGIPVQVSAVLGKSEMPVSHLLKLGRGAVIELDRKVGEAIDIYVNNRLVARGEVVVVEDRLGITMTEIIKAEAQ